LWCCTNPEAFRPIAHGTPRGNFQITASTKGDYQDRCATDVPDGQKQMLDPGELSPRNA